MTAGRAAEPVSVVMVTRNRRARVLASLDRLGELPERPPIVVVDNGSSDGTPEAVAGRHPRVRVIRLDRNAGAAARNAGVRAVETSLVAFSDDDSWWEPGSLARAARAFAARPSLGLLQARIVVGLAGTLDRTCAAMRQSPLPTPAGLPGPSILGFVACGAVARTRAFLESGGFHQRLGIGGEEELLAFDLAALGWELAYVDAVVARHHPDRSDRRSGRTERQLRNALWTTWLRRRLPGALARSVAITRAAARARRPAALVEALRGLPWVLRERHPLPERVERAAQLVTTLSDPAG
jgi:N-acetylglucosaminyl-diphospho-decaprenol L-rhamnosyltransferase